MFWTILGPDPEKRAKSICRCSCGKVRSINNYDLRSGKSTRCKSCARTRHGHYLEREHRIWEGIVNRCTRPTNTSFKWYGAKGITVCPRWANKETGYQSFLEDMGRAPSETSSIDRIDNTGGYYKENCRWATRKEQNLNRKTTRWVEVDGEMMCAKDAAKKLGVGYANFCKKLAAKKEKASKYLEKSP